MKFDMAPGPSVAVVMYANGCLSRVAPDISCSFTHEWQVASCTLVLST